MSSDLSAIYLGLELPSPVIVGACPLTIEPETVRQLVDAGAGAIVLPSILQEQIVHRYLKSIDPTGSIEQSGYQPKQDVYNGGALNYLHSIEVLKEQSRVPIIASMNGASKGRWLDYACEIESAGADALEVNLQSTMFEPGSTSDVTEAKQCEIVRQIVNRVSIPVAVKISQQYTNLASMARQIEKAGAKGIVLFTHLPNWDVCVDRKHWTIRWELSPIDSLSKILEGIVRVHSVQLGLSIAASGGVATSHDALKAMIAGANVVMVTSVVYRDGPDAIRGIIHGIRRYLELNRYATLHAFQEDCSGDDYVSEQVMRLEYVDPLTRSKTYFDPTPTASHCVGDRFGHMEG